MCHRVILSDIDGAMCVMQNSLRGGGGVPESLKINHKTFLRKRMSIGYLEPLVHFTNQNHHKLYLCIIV